MPVAFPSLAREKRTDRHRGRSQPSNAASPGRTRTAKSRIGHAVCSVPRCYSRRTDRRRGRSPRSSGDSASRPARFTHRGIVSLRARGAPGFAATAVDGNTRRHGFVRWVCGASRGESRRPACAPSRRARFFPGTGGEPFGRPRKPRPAQGLSRGVRSECCPAARGRRAPPTRRAATSSTIRVVIRPARAAAGDCESAGQPPGIGLQVLHEP